MKMFVTHLGTGKNQETLRNLQLMPVTCLSRYFIKTKYLSKTNFSISDQTCSWCSWYCWADLNRVFLHWLIFVCLKGGHLATPLSYFALLHLFFDLKFLWPCLLVAVSVAPLFQRSCQLQTKPFLRQKLVSYSQAWFYFINVLVHVLPRYLSANLPERAIFIPKTWALKSCTHSSRLQHLSG